MYRSTTGLFVLPILIGLSAGCSQSASGPAMREVVQIGTTKADLFGVPAEFRALHARLETTLKRPVTFSAQPSGEAIAQQLAMGNMKFAVMTAQDYAGVADPSKLNLLASAVNEMGKTSHKAILVARASDQRFKSISDCSGKRFAFGNYRDALTDFAARKALESGGVPVKKLLPELLPPPFAMEGRLYVQNDVAVKIALDPTVNAGVIDERVFAKLPATGGNPITGPSKDQFKQIGETEPIPELVFVAGPSASAEEIQSVSAFLTTEASKDDAVCKQMGIKGFTAAQRAEYDAVRKLMAD